MQEQSVQAVFVQKDFFLKLLSAERTKQRNCKPENKHLKKRRSIMKEQFCGLTPARQALQII